MSRAPGLHELLITEAIRAELAALEPKLHVDRSALRAAEAADRIALHLARVVQRALGDLPEATRVEEGIALARRLIAELGAAGDAPIAPGSLLRALLVRRPDGSPDAVDAPLIPLLDTTLLTNAPGEPRVGRQLETEIHSADRIDVVMAFIRMSGIRPLLPALERHVQRGRALRVLTTTYTGSTEALALDALVARGAEVRVSYDTSGTRLHAKAWLFHRLSGFSTAYIGSSNLTHSAQVAGLEWNVRVSGARNPDVVDKMAAVFETYWASADFTPYDADRFAQVVRRDGRPTVFLSPVELRPEPFQERLLERIALARQSGHHRNLLVAATGTGKTVMAAVDYARVRATLPRDRLLFVAHREEILDQAQATFCVALRSASFGERWVAGDRPERFEHVFASIQSLAHADLANLAPDHFDMVIVDEFHHAAAPSYRRLLHHVRPRELLGLTATPERADDLDVLGYFDGRIAAELRLWDAIDQNRLCPFAYYGVADGLDLREVPFARGRGYDVQGLTNLLTADDAWARRVVKAVVDHVDAPARMRALGFCVSVDHARFMARIFDACGIPARAVWADTPARERAAALDDLSQGRINALFSVDLLNEGVDLPDVDTLLFLRPTDSQTLFLQQLGRGLRRSAAKAVCTVLDFVGHHRQEFRYDRRFRALLGGTRKDVVEQIRSGFPFLPAGCHMELDRLASELVLDNIRRGIPSQWKARVAELRELGDASLPRYLDATGRELEDAVQERHSWIELREAAGLPVPPAGPHDRTLLRACGRLQHVDDLVRIETWRRFLTDPPDPDALSERSRRLLLMLLAPVLDTVLSTTDVPRDAVAILRAHPRIIAEIQALLDPLQQRIDHVHEPTTAGDAPLQVHARYSRIEILAAFGESKGVRSPTWQTGVWWARAAGADLLAFTLDKTSGAFSPTTRYKDYAVSRELIHWESQGSTAEDSDTGRRYRNHAAMGTSVHLFARLRQDDRAFWYLGPARYVRHEGERPMAITWKLARPLPGDLFQSFAAAVA